MAGRRARRDNRRGPQVPRDNFPALPTDDKVDEEYDALIIGVLGYEAVETPLRDVLGGPVRGGMTVVPDPADLGHVVAAYPTDEEKAAYAHEVLGALRRSFDAIPLDPSE